MKITEIQIGVTGCTTGYGCDRYPHTVSSVSAPFKGKGRPRKNFPVGAKYVNIGIKSDTTMSVEAAKEKGITIPADAQMLNGDCGYGGKEVTLASWYNPQNSEKICKCVLLADGEIQHGGLGYKSYNRDSSF